jgi:hypothetical protein
MSGLVLISPDLVKAGLMPFTQARPPFCWGLSEDTAAIFHPFSKA